MAIIDKIFQILITILIGIVSATIVLYASQAMAATDAEFEKVASELALELESSVITLDRDVIVYHYTNMNAPNLERVPVRHPFFREYLLKVMSQHWMVPQPSGGRMQQEGPGIYAAIDPIVSSRYGTTLLQITLKKGSRILKTYGMSSLWLQIRQKFVDLKIQFEWAKAMGPVKQRILKKLNVVGNSYEWNTSVNGFCKTSQRVAFLLVGALDPVSGKMVAPTIDVVGLVKRKSRESDEAIKAYERIYELAHIILKKQLPSEPGLETDRENFLTDGSAQVKESPSTEAEQLQFRNETFTCDGLHPEDLE